MEVGNREAFPCCRFRSLAQAMDRGKDIRLDQSQSPLGARLRTLCHDRHGLHPPRHDPHHAKATCCKRLVLNPIFSDGLLATFVGLYINIPEGGVLDIDQKRWLVSELNSAPVDRPLILAMHHFVYSAARWRTTLESPRSYLAQVLDSAEQQSGRYPAAVFSAHAMNYQRFTRHLS